MDVDLAITRASVAGKGIDAVTDFVEMVVAANKVERGEEIWDDTFDPWTDWNRVLSRKERNAFMVVMNAMRREYWKYHDMLSMKGEKEEEKDG